MSFYFHIIWERCATGKDVTGSDVSHMTGSDVSHVTGSDIITESDVTTALFSTIVVVQNVPLGPTLPRVHFVLQL